MHSCPGPSFERSEDNRFSESADHQLKIACFYVTLVICRVVEHIGSGQFGTVSKGVWQSPGGAVDVAVKVLHPGSQEEDRVKFL